MLQRLSPPPTTQVCIYLIGFGGGGPGKKILGAFSRSMPPPPPPSSSSSSSSVDFPRRAQQQKLMEEEGEEYSCPCYETIDHWTPLSPDVHCLLLPKQRTADAAGLDLEDRARNKAFDIEDPARAKTAATQKELEYMSNFAFLLSILSYGVLYLVGSAKLGRNGDNTRLVICLHAWTAVMVLLLFIGSYIRWPAGVMKIMRLVMSGVVFVSALVIFILAHRAP